MKNNKNLKKILIVISILIILVIISNNVIKLKKKQIFIENLNKASSAISEFLSIKTITGDAKFKFNVTNEINNKDIVTPAEYNAEYKIDFINKYADFEFLGEHKEGNLNSNVYIKEEKLYFLIKDVYEKYIPYNINKLDIINNRDNYSTVIVTLIDVLSENLKKGYFNYDKVKLDGKKVDKITLDLSGKNYRSIMKKIKKILKHNDEFVNSAYKLFGYYGEDFDEFLNIIKVDSYKFSIFIDKETKELFKIKIDSDEIDININHKKNKYSFEYYLRDGLVYNGYIKLDNNNIKSVNLNDFVNHLKIKIDFSDINIKYNEELIESKNIDNIINYSDIDKEEIEIITNNEIVENIYNNYTDRFKDDITEAKEEVIEPSELLPEDYHDKSDGSIGY